MPRVIIKKKIVHAESKRGGGGVGVRGASLLGDDVKEKKDFLKLRCRKYDERKRNTVVKLRGR